MRLQRFSELSTICPVVEVSIVPLLEGLVEVVLADVPDDVPVEPVVAGVVIGTMATEAGTAEAPAAADVSEFDPPHAARLDRSALMRAARRNVI